MSLTATCLVFFAIAIGLLLGALVWLAAVIFRVVWPL